MTVVEQHLATMEMTLGELPNDDRLIADFLVGYNRDRDIRGYCSDPSACVLANYLADMTGLFISVGSNRVTQVSNGRVWYLSEAAQSFIRHFDLRHYPELMR